MARIVTPWQAAVALITAARAGDYDSANALLDSIDFVDLRLVVMILTGYCDGMMAHLDAAGIPSGQFLRALGLLNAEKADA